MKTNMYDILTTVVLFFMLVPGVVVTIPPGSSILVAALVHAIVFWACLQYLATYVPWWGIWIIAIVAVGGKMYASRPAAPAPM
jgi:hypothetical protein